MKYLFFSLVASSVLFVSCKKENDLHVRTIGVLSQSGYHMEVRASVENRGTLPVLQQGFVWATHSGPTFADSVKIDTSKERTFISLIGGLQANTNYYLRAYAFNVSSGIIWGNEIIVTTLYGLPTLGTTIITNQPSSAIAASSVLNGGGGTVTERGIVYSTNPNPTISDFKIVSGAGTGDFSATLSPLTSRTTYYVRPYATIKIGTAYGKQVQFTAF